jgi:hypothetical protein
MRQSEATLDVCGARASWNLSADSRNESRGRETQQKACRQKKKRIGKNVLGEPICGDQPQVGD